MKTYEKILLENKAWAEENKKLDPDYFSRINTIEHPEILWLGSTDSRVEINEITNTDPGEIIAYRNMANLVKKDSLSFMTVLRHALYKDKIKHIIICGHNHCSGIQEVLSGDTWKMAEDWLAEVNDIYQKHINEFEGLNKDEKELHLAALNVRHQINELQNLPEIRDIWEKENRPKLHGWLYNTHTGLIKSLVEVEPDNNRIGSDATVDKLT